MLSPFDIVVLAAIGVFILNFAWTNKIILPHLVATVGIAMITVVSTALLISTLASLGPVVAFTNALHLVTAAVLYAIVLALMRVWLKDLWCSHQFMAWRAITRLRIEVFHYDHFMGSFERSHYDLKKQQQLRAGVGPHVIVRDDTDVRAEILRGVRLG